MVMTMLLLAVGRPMLCSIVNRSTAGTNRSAVSSTIVLISMGSVVVLMPSSFHVVHALHPNPAGLCGWRSSSSACGAGRAHLICEHGSDNMTDHKGDPSAMAVDICVRGSRMHLWASNQDYGETDLGGLRHVLRMIQHAALPILPTTSTPEWQPSDSTRQTPNPKSPAPESQAPRIFTPYIGFRVWG